jgi:hypothetical protein
MPLEELPRIDEHAVTVAASPGAAWDAAAETLRRSFSGARAQQVARLLGCEPASTAGNWPAVGSSVPGFGVVAADRPHLLVVEGRHRFSRYGIVVRVEPAPGGARVAAESRAAFPGLLGTGYRLAVVGTGGHALGVHRLLRHVASQAEVHGKT